MLTTFRYGRVSIVCVGSAVAVQVVYLVSRACQLFIQVDVQLTLGFCCFFAPCASLPYERIGKQSSFAPLTMTHGR